MPCARVRFREDSSELTLDPRGVASQGLFVEELLLGAEIQIQVPPARSRARANVLPFPGC